MPSCRVVKNGSQTDGSTCSGMPPTGVAHLDDDHRRAPAAVGHVGADPEPSARGIASSALERISRMACSSCMGSTRTCGRVAGTAISRSTGCSRIGSRPRAGARSISRGRLSRHRVERRRPAEAEQVADAAVEPIHLLDDGVEVLAWRRATSGWRRTSCAAARRLASGFRSPCATAADISPIEASFSACTSCARDSRSCPVIGRERAGQVADLVARRGLDRVVEIAPADDRHRVGQLR